MKRNGKRNFLLIKDNIQKGTTKFAILGDSIYWVVEKESRLQNISKCSPVKTFSFPKNISQPFRNFDLMHLMKETALKICSQCKIMKKFMGHALKEKALVFWHLSTFAYHSESEWRIRAGFPPNFFLSPISQTISLSSRVAQVNSQHNHRVNFDHPPTLCVSRPFHGISIGFSLWLCLFLHDIKANKNQPLPAPRFPTQIQ